MVVEAAEDRAQLHLLAKPCSNLLAERPVERRLHAKSERSVERRVTVVRAFIHPHHRRRQHLRRYRPGGSDRGELIRSEPSVKKIFSTSF